MGHETISRADQVSAVIQDRVEVFPPGAERKPLEDPLQVRQVGFGKDAVTHGNLPSSSISMSVSLQRIARNGISRQIPGADIIGLFQGVARGLGGMERRNRWLPE
jgi:hypothetical protein